jgi:hypothetical protein
MKCLGLMHAFESASVLGLNLCIYGDEISKHVTNPINSRAHVRPVPIAAAVPPTPLIQIHLL